MTISFKDKQGYIIYMPTAKMNKFAIGTDKHPLCAWRKKENWEKDASQIPGAGAGIPTGEDNNIIVVDVDDYAMKENNPFIKKFGKDYHHRFNTYIVRTASGGKHLYFKYDKDLNKTAHPPDINIDFQSNGAYVVAAGSNCYPKQESHLSTNLKTTKKYIVIKDNPISTIPPELKEFIITHVINKDPKRIIKIQKDTRQTKIKHSATDPFYKWKLDDKIVEIICSDLDAKLFKSYDSWWKLAMAFKEIGYKSIFLKYSILKAPWYSGQKDNNEKLYDSITQFSEFNFIWLLKNWFNEVDEDEPIQTKQFINTYKYKDVYKQEPVFTIDKTINVDKLGKGMEIGYQDYIIHSDTGTGKTTIVKEYLRTVDPSLRFISITARISLAAEQYRVFRGADLSCKYYEDVKNDSDEYWGEGDSGVGCINSLLMLLGQYFGVTILFLDEFNSLIEDLFCSPTMKDRILIINMLEKIIRECKQVIVVDADIQHHTLEFLRYCGREPIFIKNTYQHNAGNNAKEWDTVEDMVDNLKEKDAWFLCTDSKTTAKTIFKQLSVGEQIPLTEDEEKNVNGFDYYKDAKGIMIVITAESNMHSFALDDFKRIIYSPKIIYGLDGTMDRDIYCIYEETTISPRAMNQQVNRCRNIKSLNFVFMKNIFTAEKYIEMGDVYEQIVKRAEYTNFFSVESNKLSKLYKNMAGIIQFNDDAFSTNKKAHFVSRLESAGWNVSLSTTDRLDRDNKSFKQQKKILKDAQYTDFPALQIKLSPYFKKINKYFKIPQSEWLNYRNVFLDGENSRTRNLNMGRFLFSSHTTLLDEVQDKIEFNDVRFKSPKYKVAFLQQFMIEAGAKNKLDYKIGKTNNFTSAEWAPISDATKKKYELLFKPTKKMIESMHNPIIKMFGDLFGSNVVSNWNQKDDKIKLFNEQKTTRNKKSVRIKTDINMDFIDQHVKLITHRFEKKFIGGGLNIEFGKEADNFVKDDSGGCLITDL